MKKGWDYTRVSTVLNKVWQTSLQIWNNFKYKFGVPFTRETHEKSLFGNKSDLEQLINELFVFYLRN